MAALPSDTKRVNTRIRALLNDGTYAKVWWEVDREGTIALDPQLHSQYKRGEYRFIAETVTETVVYSEVP